MDLAYSSELQCMMYVNGDSEQPDFKTARYIEIITKKQLLELLKKNENEEITFPNLFFLLRSQLRLLIRIVRNAEIQEKKNKYRAGISLLVRPLSISTTVSDIPEIEKKEN